MFNNYFKIILRKLWKNKTASFINVFGLTFGITSCLLIALYIQHEASYDDFQKNGDRIARVIMEYKFGGGESAKGNFTSVRVAPVLKRTFPEVESAVKLVQYERVVSYADKLFTEKRFLYADPSFFDIFSFRLTSGNPRTALLSPHNVVLTKSAAHKYFGNENPVGKALKISSDSNLYQITGVMPDCPSNSQIKFDFLASFSSLGITPDYEDTYWDANYTTFLLLKNKNAIASLQAKLPPFMKKEMQGQGATVNFYLEPFTRIHLHSEYAGFEPNNSITYIYILAAVALLILIIACFTYINLSTARSVERAKEVGVRKVMGAEKQQIFWQFIGESAALCVIAVAISLIAAVLLLPLFNQLTKKQLPVGSLFSLPFIGFIVLAVVCISLLAGSYPAFILSQFQPVKVLKGAFKNTGSAQWLRKSLIVFQFVISVFLIISTFIIQQQLYYIQHKKLGYDREHVIVLKTGYQLQDRIPLIKQQLKQNPDVVSVSSCYRSPVEGGGGYNMRSDMMPETEQLAVTANPIDEDFIQTTGMQLIAGSNLSRQDMKDAGDEQKDPLFHFILNESAARQLGWTPGEAIGKKMFLDATRPGYVRGVVKDFHFESLHNPIKPIVLFPEEGGRELLIKLSGRNLRQTLSFLGTKWKELVPERPFDYRFLDEDYNTLYDAELRLGVMMNLFSAIAIVLACLGLFGLSAYAAQQRVKEIGVRKVLGASTGNIVAVLSKDFIQLAAIAILIAFPIAWWAMHSWLQSYQYRIGIEWWVFLVTGIVTLLIALLTVSFQAIKAAMANPVMSLRTE